ncbi:hypothetical protein FWJ25_13830 [Marinobacter salinexigens]|uniref:Lipoprotein n=1 Tax=Marinobacter salinexigens TaxID=2919747 RepID=A0A5B0VEL7_9GAMM|nr:YbaY family lipoprotein [Marinobacter salinexigens]KAA1172884.1 hypothetical protein FWJ25_13830 [Marinobacter salinexigens]
MRLKAAWLISACTLLLAACATQEQPMTDSGQTADNTLMRVISGEVWYRERIALVPGAKVVVTLEDVSRADAPATVITDYTYVVDGKAPPYPFKLVYSPSAIDERMTYALRAKILKDGKLLFINTQRVDPFAGEPGEPVRIMVSKTGG